MQGRAVQMLLLLALGFAGAASWPRPLPRGLEAGARARHVRILRDSWGVPHVFGWTDPDVAFGLAYAHAEDDFETIQATLLAARGQLASVYGKDAAPNDYMVRLLRVSEFVDQGYPRDLQPETRALCEAYAAGLNLYAARHPSAAIAALYPVRGRDVVQGFVHKLPLFFGMDRVLRRLFQPDATPEDTLGRAERASRSAALLGWPADVMGSNAFAVAPRRSADGATRLAINSHQPWEGPVAWYEAHLRSEEGWDMVGGLFPGTPLVLHGHNRDLGWAHTVNFPDLIDVYALEIDPASPARYRYDGAWRDLERRRVRIDVKLLGPLHWTVEREALWSVYGPVVRRPDGGAFAIRFAAMGDVRAVEQWFRMNKSHSIDEWTTAMSQHAIPMFHTAYADAKGNVAYLYNARLPLRAPGFDWSKELPGNTSATLWTDSLPFDRLPRVVNPPSGFVQSANSSPFETTIGAGNPDRALYADSLGIETRMTNRALRLTELLGADPSITREAFDAVKFDLAYSERSVLAARRRQLLDAPPPRDALASEALQVLARWDLRTDPANTSAAVGVLTLRPDDRNDPKPIATETLITRIAVVARELKRHFGRIDVPWGEVNRLRRGALDLGLGGAPDVLRAVYASPQPDGRLRGIAGDSYVLMVEWDKDGRVSSRSVHNFGSATKDARSPHYADQAPLFVRQELKPVWMDERDIRAHLEREYRPGDR